MLIQAYGLFWRVDEVDWEPGSGNKGRFRLLGRRGHNLPGLQVADFRDQHGLYVLYGNYGPHYVGLTRKQGIGRRLKDHLRDDHAQEWDRFSWFGFRRVLKGKDELGLHTLAEMATTAVGKNDDVIGDVETLLIRALGLPSTETR